MPQKFGKTSEEIEALKYVMIRRWTGIHPTSRLVLMELMSHDIPNSSTGRRNGFTFVAQETIGEYLGFSRQTINKYFQELKETPFIGRTEYDVKRRVMFTEVLWDNIYAETVKYIDDWNAKIDEQEQNRDYVPKPSWKQGGEVSRGVNGVESKDDDSVESKGVDSQGVNTVRQETIEGKLYNRNLSVEPFSDRPQKTRRSLSDKDWIRMLDQAGHQT